MKGKVKKTNFFDKFNKNEKGIKNISNLLNLIYDENTERNVKQGVGRTIYEGTFGIKNIPEIQSEENFVPLENSFENESKNIDIKNSINNNANYEENNNNNNLEINNNNNLEEFDDENPYLEYQNKIEDNNINNDFNLKNNNINEFYNNNDINNNIENNMNINNYEKLNNINNYNGNQKLVKVRKIPNIEFIEDHQLDINQQEIPLEKNYQ